MSRKELKLTFLGVRGSYHLSEPSSQRYGGNTSTIHIETDDLHLFIDAGSGITKVPSDLSEKETYLYFTHYHWDHVQGLPFFAPLYRKDFILNIRGMKPEYYSLEEALSIIFNPPFCPIGYEAVKGKINSQVIPQKGTEKIGELVIDHIPIMHPGGSVGYKVSYGGKSIVILTDVEISRAFATYEADFNQLKAFIQGADYLIMDGSMTESEYYGKSGSNKVGWGHSTMAECARLANESGVMYTFVTHYLPYRDDKMNDSLYDAWHGDFPNLYFAKEDETIVIIDENERR